MIDLADWLDEWDHYRHPKPTSWVTSSAFAYCATSMVIFAVIVIIGERVFRMITGEDPDANIVCMIAVTVTWMMMLYARVHGVESSPEPASFNRYMEDRYGIGRFHTDNENSDWPAMIPSDRTHATWMTGDELHEGLIARDGHRIGLYEQTGNDLVIVKPKETS